MSIFKPGTLTPTTPITVAPPSNMWVPIGNPRVHVIDMYHGDNVTNWATLAKYAAACVHKISIGTSARDPLASNRWPLFTQYGLRRGGYHWFENTNGTDQFDYFLEALNAAGGLAPRDRILALDYEPASYSKAHVPIIQAWGERCKEVTGRIPMIYCSKSAIPELGNPSFFRNWYAWIAAPSNSSAPIIPPFTSTTLWQYAETSFPGMQGSQVDVNWFPGSAEELDSL